MDASSKSFLLAFQPLRIVGHVDGNSRVAGKLCIRSVSHCAESACVVSNGFPARNGARGTGHGGR
jgi:hypothetical protein